MKKLLSVLLTIYIIAVSLSAGAVVSFAAGTKIDNTGVLWSYDSETKVLKFTGEGAIPDYNEYKNSSGDINLVYPWKNLAYTSIEFDSKITGIGNYAFCYSEKLKSVVIPENITSLGKGVFLNCETLQSADVQSTAATLGQNLFAGCSSLKTVTVAKGAKTVGAKAFYNCTDLESVTLPSGITSVGSEAFSNCVSLSEIVLPDTVKTIGDYAFYSCEALKSVSFGKKLQTVSENAFDNCRALESAVFPDTLKTIESEAFSGCSKLSSVTLPDGVEKIQQKAFVLCPLLKSVQVGPYAEIEPMAFGYGKSNAKVDGFTVSGYEETNAQTYAKANGFAFVSLGHYTYGDCGEKAKWSFNTETGVLTISGEGAMADYLSISNPAPYKRFASDITEIVIGDGITSLGNYCFYNIGPNSINVPETVTKIGTKAIGKYSNGVLKDGYQISGYIGSAAEKYASDMKIEFIDLTPYSGACGTDVKWNFDRKTKTLTLSGTGSTFDFTAENRPVYEDYPIGVKNIVVEEGVTGIGTYALVFDNAVESITFGKSIKTLGENSFGFIKTKSGLKADEALKAYGFNKTPVSEYAEKVGFTYISIDPPELPEFALVSSLHAKVDRENKVIYLYQLGMASAYFLENFPTDLFKSVKIENETITTGTVIELATEELTENYTIVVPGDTNGDGFINSLDALAILNHSVENTLLEGSALFSGDINSDGIINSGDALIALQISVGQMSVESLLKAE